MNAADDRRRAGVFLLVAAGLLLLLVGVVVGVRLFSREKVYFVEFTESVAGLEPSSSVKYNGVPAGSVDSIQFLSEDISKIRVRIRLRPDVPVKMNTRAALKPQGITGLFYLELYGGTNAAEDLPEGDVIPSDVSLSSSITGIAKNLGELVERLNRFFANNEQALAEAIRDFRVSAGLVKGTLEKVEAIAAEGKAALQDARAAIADVRTELRVTAEAVRSTVAELDAFLKDPGFRELPGKVGAMIDRAGNVLEGVDIRGLVQRADEAVAEFRKIEASLQKAADSLADAAVEGREDLSAALANIRRASENVKEVTRMIRDDPTRVLAGRPVADKPIPDAPPPLPEGKR